MRDETVARSYAETLFELAHRNDALDEYGEGIRTVGMLLDTDPKFRLFVETPRIPDEDKKRVLKAALDGQMPKNVVNFVLVTLDKRRQRLLRSIAQQYHELLDAHMGREHVEVTVARPMDDAGSKMIAERLSKALGREAIPHIRVNPAILGGLVVRTGDTIYDGSVRRRLEGMRRRLLQADMPAHAGDSA